MLAIAFRIPGECIPEKSPNRFESSSPAVKRLTDESHISKHQRIHRDQSNLIPLDPEALSRKLWPFWADAALMIGAYRALAATLHHFGDFEGARQYAMRGVQLWHSGNLQSPVEELHAPAIRKRVLDQQREY